MKKVSTKSDDDLKYACDYLQKVDSVFTHIYQTVGSPKPRWKGDGFSGLVNIILGQQISVVVADTLRKRFYEYYGLSVDNPTDLTPEHCLLGDDWSVLGISMQKSNYIRNVATAINDGILDLNALSNYSTDDMINALITIKGIGRWSAENYAIFCDGRSDLFPIGDLGIKKGMAMLWNNNEPLSDDDMYLIAQNWKPYRTVAALMIWQYYTEKSLNQSR